MNTHSQNNDSALRPDQLGVQEWIAALSQAVSSAHGNQACVLLETHISWVLLVGETAYKIKKPVDLGFCDFTSLERRRQFCHEEVRLNRRLAPELYLDVRRFVPIRPDQSGTLRLDNEPDPLPDERGSHSSGFEYAVRMRRFLQSDLLSQIAAVGELRRDWFDELATTLAEFHRAAPIAEASSIAGTSEAVWAPVVECLNTVKQVAEAEESKHAVARLERWLTNERARLLPWFATRKQDGHIRECHGDLHLRNMVLQDGKIVIFDCIEFNDALRWIDTASDLAFALMDLEDRGAEHLSHRLKSGYLEQSEDYEMLPGLRYYMVYRALVRAKVAALRYQQIASVSNERREAAEEFHNYLDVAQKFIAPTQPFVAITHGLSGSGKSSAALQVVEDHAAVRIRSDVVRRRQFGEDPNRYTAEATQWTYAKLMSLAKAIIAARYSVAVDATFLRSSERQQFKNLAASANVPFVILDCRAPVAELRKRILARRKKGGDPSEADLSVLELQSRSHEPLTAEELPYTIDVASCPASGELNTAIGLRVPRRP